MKNKSNKTMRAVAIDEFGGLEKMKPRQLSVPEIDANEILVHVDTAGVGAWDPFEREGGFAKEFARELPGLIVFASERLHFGFREFANGFLEQFLIVGESEVHGCSRFCW